jgi:hypothetical protein
MSNISENVDDTNHQTIVEEPSNQERTVEMAETTSSKGVKEEKETKKSNKSEPLKKRNTWVRYGII